MALDDIDRAILGALQEDGRLSWSALGERVGLSPPAATERVRRMERAGVITGIRAHVDPEAAGLGTLAFVAVALNNPVEHRHVVDMAGRVAEVLECHVVAGRYDVLLKVRTASPLALAQLLRSQVRSLPGVTATNSIMVLESIKETGQLPLPSGP